MNKSLRATLAMVVPYPAAPIAVYTDNSEGGAWFRTTWRFANGQYWAAIRTVISLQ